MSLSFTFAAVTLEVRSDDDHICVLILVFEAAVIVIVLLSFYSYFWCIHSHSLSNLRRKDHLDWRNWLGFLAAHLFLSRVNRFFVPCGNGVDLSRH